MIGVLLSNLGTPDQPTPRALKKYLKEFLSDPRIIDNIPRPIWWFILNGIILNTRPARSAKLYQRVWTDAGSPLLVTTELQARYLEQKLRNLLDKNICVAVGMRYGNPSIASALDALAQKGCQKMVVLPLYPQYSSATTASTFDAVAQALTHKKHICESRMIYRYYQHPDYIKALENSIREFWGRRGHPDKILFSFHGVPERFSREGDPYQEECEQTTHSLVKALGLPDESWLMSFQSRFGREEWLKPYTDQTLESWGKSGVQSVDVVCPGFASDCLETIEEIGQENKEIFLSNGGVQYRYIPALNDRPDHISLMTKLIVREMKDWL